MSAARAARLALALAAAALVPGCHRASRGVAHGSQPATAQPGTPVRLDSLEGTIRVVGVDALPMVTLAFDDGRPALTLDGPASLRRATGLRVAVLGERSGSRLAVRRFLVIAANGIPATDGMLVADRDALVLVTADGARHRLVDPPPFLRANAGHRVWLSGPLDHPPVAFGIIE